MNFPPQEHRQFLRLPINRKFFPFVPKKYLRWKHIERREIPILSQWNNFQVSLNTRCYFGNNTELKGSRIIGIEVVETLIDKTFFAADLFCFTLVAKKEEANIKQDDFILDNYPLADLQTRSTPPLQNNHGKVRVFDITNFDIEKSFVQFYAPGLVITTQALIPFIFYTVDW